MERWSLNRLKIKLAGGFLKLNDYRMNFWTAIKIRLVINEIAKKKFKSWSETLRMIFSFLWTSRQTSFALIKQLKKIKFKLLKSVNFWSLVQISVQLFVLFSCRSRKLARFIFQVGVFFRVGFGLILKESN